MPDNPEKVDDLTLRDLKLQPLGVIKTAVPDLAKALGLRPDELFRQMVASERMEAEGNECRCCGSDGW